MSYTFGKPQAAVPYTGVGEFKDEPFVLSLTTRVKVVVRPTRDKTRTPVGAEVDPAFEPALRKAIADHLIGANGGGFEVVYVAVEQFEDAGG